MKLRVKNACVRVCSVAMVSLLLAGICASPSGEEGSLLSAAAESGLTDVTGTYDVDSLRTQYLSSDSVSANTSVANEERWVIVSFDEDCLMDHWKTNNLFTPSFSDYANSTNAQTLASRLVRAHKSFLNALSSKGISYEYKYSYTALTNGVAIKIKNKDVAAVKSMANVSDVYASEAYATPTVAVSNNANVYTTGIYDSSGVEEEGKGMVVAILDTGLDYTHNAFSTMPEAERMTRSNVQNAWSELNIDSSVSVKDVYYNSKIPFAYDYADDDADVFPSYSSHGTHVAGIVAGKDDTKQITEDETFIGVAPEAQLVICKVFSDDLDSKLIGNAEETDILAAVQDCVTLGVDVINMSLGTACGFSEEGYATESNELLSNVYDSVEEAGISLICAAGNEYSSGYGGAYGTNLATNPDSGTISSPSSYAAALSVASINGEGSSYFYVNGDEDEVGFITEAADATGEAYDFLDMLYEAAGADTSQPLTLNYVVIGGVGRSANYTTSIKRALPGAIAVIKRGDISFAEKVQIAMANGALACIIYNNVSGSIRMNLGEVTDPIPTCSISMDAGKLLVDGATASKGTITFSYSQSAGPFMSDFSSWGPTPSLEIKPEITAHGGEITSSVSGGYDTYSGTSMATPNMSGAVALLRQNLQSNEELTGTDLNERVYQLLMSTATMARNEEGNPYSPRKQGAGLGNIEDAMNAEGYLTVKNDDGTVSSKPKLELGDDPEKTGVYEMTFTVNNRTDSVNTYTPAVYVMTESLSSDGKTVAEKAYMLENCGIAVWADGIPVSDGGTVSVPANGTTEVTVIVTLDQTAKEYIDETFENGMYVEGFVRLESDELVELGIPYLAFYGDWTDAPLFDYTAYEVAASEADGSVDDEDKLQASAAATRVYGLYYDSTYVVMLGSYLYEMSDEYTDIVASEEYAALSCFDTENQRTVYQLYMVYAGLLRGAKQMEIEITDATTGEVVYSLVDYNVRKSYASGGSNVGASISLGINPAEWGLANNSKYTITLKGYLDYESGDLAISEANSDSFSFTFTVDMEAPVISDYRIRYEAYTENKETKYRIYLDADVYDNQYVMSLLPCYVDDENTLQLFTSTPVPVYSSKGGTTTVSIEITDYYEQYVATGQLYLVVEDYALNSSMYLVSATAATEYPESVTLTTDSQLTYSSSASGYDVYSLVLSKNECYTVNATAYPDTTSAAALTFASASGSNGIYCKNNQIFNSLSSGTGTVYVYSRGTIVAKIEITIGDGGGASSTTVEKIVLAPLLNGEGNLDNLEDSEIELHPNTTTQFTASVEPWYYPELYSVIYVWSSSNEAIFTVDQSGNVTTKATGSAYLTVSVQGSSLKKMIRIVVSDELDVENNILYHYYGGKDVVIEDYENISSIDEECFQGNTTIESLVIPKTITSITANAFEGCTNLKTVYLPAECVLLYASAFKNCTSLETVYLYAGEDSVGTLTLASSVFEGCTSLKYIYTINSDGTAASQTRLTSAGSYSFAGCTSLESIDLSELRTGGTHIFEGCTALTSITTSSKTYYGAYMFYGCTALNNVAFTADAVPDYAFYGCSSLNAITFADELDSLGDYAFAGTAFTSFTLPGGSYTVGSHAFANCARLSEVIFSQTTRVTFSSSPFAGCSAFTAYSVRGVNDYYTAIDGILYSADATVLYSVPGGKDLSSFTLPSSVEKISSGAFAGTNLTEIDLSNVRSVGAYAFAESALTQINISALETVSEGLFYGCTKLADVTTAVDGESTITSIGDYAFYGCTALRQSLELPNVTSIGAYAFANAKVYGLTANLLAGVGDFAFYGAHLYTRGSDYPAISLPALTQIGAYAFAGNTGLTTISLGAVTSMGDYAFSGSGVITVTFAEGTTVIGSYAFIAEDALSSALTVNNTALTTVTLPDTVEEIGAYAFYNCTKLSSINLAGVNSVGEGAFCGCSALTSADLHSAVTVGDYAFMDSSLSGKLELDAAVQIGTYAFSGTSVTGLSIPSAKIVGSFAFYNTKLTSVTIPASLDSLTYDDTYITYDADGKPETQTGKKTASLGAAAFAGIATLSAFTVEGGNGLYFVQDGVLYSKLSSGQYELVQYPAGKTATSYTVLDNTVRIADGAFFYVSALKTVTFPYTVRTIGSYAFYGCSTGTTFVFTSVEAPILEAQYDLSAAYIYDSSYSTSAYYDGLFYSNFYYYAAYVLYNGYDYLLTVSYPENGTGYDSSIWSAFFSTSVTSEYAAEEITRRAQEAIQALPSVSAINSGVAALSTSAEKLAYVKSVSETVQEARLLYNQISSSGQQEMIAEEYETLLEIEALIRTLRVTYGDTVEIASVSVTQQPTKYKYTVGETFDSSGMVVTVVYDDYSQVTLSDGDYTIDKAGVALTLSDEEVIVSYVYGGETYTCVVYIQVEEESEETPAETNTKKKKGCGSAVAAGGAAALLLLSGAAFLVCRKRKED